MPTTAGVVAYSSELTDLTSDHWSDIASPELSTVRKNRPLILPNGHSVITTYPSHLGAEGQYRKRDNFYMKRKRAEGPNRLSRGISLQRGECTFHCL